MYLHLYSLSIRLCHRLLEPQDAHYSYFLFTARLRFVWCYRDAVRRYKLNQRKSLSLAYRSVPPLKSSSYLFFMFVSLSLFGCITSPSTALTPLKSSAEVHSKHHLKQSIIPDLNPDETQEKEDIQDASDWLPEPKTESLLFDIEAKDSSVQSFMLYLAAQANRKLNLLATNPRTVSLNLQQVSLASVLAAFEAQTGLVTKYDQQTITVSDDVDYLKTYHIDYLNMSRQMRGQIDISTQVSTLSLEASGGSGATGNNSWANVANQSSHDFWQTLQDNLNIILAVDKNASQSNIVIHKETGVLQVVAQAQQHRRIQAYLEQVMESAWRQVFIEATVVEVSLNDIHQTGVDWQKLKTNNNGGVISQLLLPGSPRAQSVVNPVTALLSYREDFGRNTTVSATLKALHQFGRVKVLSSPKIIALNNQAAILKVVDNRVYFTSKVDRDYNADGNLTREAWETQVKTVPVGLVMNVLPYVTQHKNVILNVRPTISRILGFVNDPNPALNDGGNEIISAIPELQVRELESVLRVRSGQTIVIGGLMQDKRETTRSGVPGLENLPLLGHLFHADDIQIQKTELLIFLRTTVLSPHVAATSN